MTIKVPSAALCTALVALAAAGCGGGSDKQSSSDANGDAGASQTPAPTTGSGAAQTPTGASTNLKLSADPSGQLKFDKKSLSAKAGNVTITMDNPSPVPHAVAVEGNGVDKDGQTVSKDGKSTVTASLKPGTYTFYCPVDGHRAAGMQGTLTVK